MSAEIRREVAGAILATVIVLAALEVAVRVTYAVRDSLVDYVPLPYLLNADYGPTPPWLGVEGSDGKRLIVPDPVLVWRGRPSSERTYVDVFTSIGSEDELRSLRHDFLPSLPGSLRDNETWTVSTNSEGFRDSEFPESKVKGSFRILALGDSWTFGSNVAGEAAYPRQLEAILRDAHPGADFEVVNLGVLGYATYNGLKLLETRGLELDPDAVILAFAMNEPSMKDYEVLMRKRAGDGQSRPALAGRVARSLGEVASSVGAHVELFQLLKYWALRFRWKPRSLGEDVDVLEERGMWEDYVAGTSEEGRQWWDELVATYERHYREMVDIVRSHGAVPILLYNEFWQDSPYVTVLRRLSDELGVPFVDGSLLLAEARRRIELDLERDLRLSPPVSIAESGSDSVRVVFRGHLPDHEGGPSLFIVGPHPQLGDLVPNKVALFDDGTHGDQRANDRVWSYTAPFERGTMIYYMYTNGGSDKEGTWEGLDVPAVRNFTIDSTESRSVVYGPIDTFGEMYMRADFWHPNANGYRLIAEELARVLRGEPQVASYLEGVDP